MDDYIQHHKKSLELDAISQNINKLIRTKTNQKKPYTQKGISAGFPFIILDIIYSTKLILPHLQPP